MVTERNENNFNEQNQKSMDTMLLGNQIYPKPPEMIQVKRKSKG